MTWNSDPDKAFPARHPREPDGLRQDILDEIADHLACAAEREKERQEDDSEGAVWDRVLGRFGDPDAIARKLWWDQMWEAVMREWIQTGVMVVVTIAVLAGLAMMTRLVAGVGTANDAMREAMKQVAASNENLAKAMAEQRAGNEAMLKALSGIQGGGGEKPDALELSTIEIVVRRGTPEGPPAPEVKVQMRGQGPGESSLSVEGELDEKGRATFGRLSQGAYTFSFQDTRSGLFSEKSITIFAGRGAGEHIIVAPDVTPRLVHIDWGLPAYGRDEELLIGTTLVGRWAFEGQEWRGIAAVVTGHKQTSMFESLKGYMNQVSAGAIRSGDAPLQPCLLAGDVSVADCLYLTRRMESEERWGRTNPVQLSGKPLPAMPGGVVWKAVPDAVVVELTAVSEGNYAAALPDELLGEYGRFARLNRNRERVPSEDHETWRNAISEELTDSYLIKMEALPAGVRGEWHDGAAFVSAIRNDPGALPVQHIAALALPDDWRADVEGGHQGMLGVRIDASFESIDSDNVLEAYVIRSDWRSQPWTYWTPLDQQNIGTKMELDTSPFWTISGEEIRARSQSTSDFYVPVPAKLGSDGNAPMTGILLRWQRPSDISNSWPSAIEEGGKTNNSPRWIVTEPIDAAVQPAVKP